MEFMAILKDSQNTANADIIATSAEYISAPAKSFTFFITCPIYSRSGKSFSTENTSAPYKSDYGFPAPSKLVVMQSSPYLSVPVYALQRVENDI